MVTYSPGKDWNKTKTEHDSSLSFQEMHELISRITTDIPGMTPPDPNMPDEIQILRACLTGERNASIFLEKGIHEADQLHDNLSCKAVGSSQFHIYVKQGTKALVSTAPLASTPLRDKSGTSGKIAQVPLFEYKNSGISWRLNPSTQWVLWPAVFEKNGYAGRKRGNSLSVGNSGPIEKRGPNPKTEILVNP